MGEHKREFKATEGLLHDVMRKQAGSIEKAILEAVMNSIDAGADDISIDFNESEIYISDNGKGMERSEVEEYFEQFGLKDDDIADKEFGKFRMGRGQIFNFGQNIWHSLNNIMVVDLENDEATISVDGEEHELDTSGLSYNLLETETEYKGCQIQIQLYNELDDVSELESSIKTLIKYIPWLHDVDITINSEPFYQEFDYDFESETAYHKLYPDQFGSRTTVYNKGAYVSEFSVTNTKATVVTKKDLDVNFARNDIIDGDEVWEQAREELIEVVKQNLAERENIGTTEKRWMLEQASEDRAYFNDISNIELIEDIKGNSWSLSQLSGEKISYSNKGNKVAENAMEQSGVTVLDQDFEEQVKDVVDSSDHVALSSVIEEDMKFEMNEIPDDELSKKRKDRLDELRWALRQLGFRGEVRAGWSKTSNVWKNDEGIVYIHKNYLKKKKSVFQTTVLLETVRVAAHNGDSRQGFETDWTYHEQFHKYMKDFDEVQQRIISGNTGVQLS